MVKKETQVQVAGCNTAGAVKGKKSIKEEERALANQRVHPFYLAAGYGPLGSSRSFSPSTLDSSVLLFLLQALACFSWQIHWSDVLYLCIHDDVCLRETIDGFAGVVGQATVPHGAHHMLVFQP